MTKKEIEDFQNRDLAEREAIVKVLEEKEGRKVHDLSFRISESEVVRLFVKEPERLTKMRSMDMSSMGQIMEASDMLLRACVINSETDPRVLDESTWENDKYYMTALMACQKLVVIYGDALKKK